MHPALGAPLQTRNQHPLVATFGLPAPLPARLADPGGGAASLTVNWASFAAGAGRGASRTTLDGETIDVRFRVDHALAPRWGWHAELAWRDLSGGSLDSAVDDWHDLFNLGGGSRNQLPQDQLLIELVELSVAASRELSDRWQLFGQASLVWLGEGDLLPELQEDYAGSLLAGVTWQATAAFELTGQLEANTAVFDTGTDLDGDAVVLTLGGAFRSAGGWRFDLGFSEDVAVNASPDFVIVAGVGRSF